MELRTDKRIEELKADWLADPCWDIEDTEGFEAYREELKIYRLQKQSDWAKERSNKLILFAESIGLAENLKLAEHLQSLQNRIHF